MPRGPRKLAIEFGATGLTHYGGVYLLHRFLSRVGFKDAIAREIRLAQRNNRYGVGEMLLALLYPILLGLDRIDTTQLLRQNGVFQYLTGLPSYPDATTLRRFLLRVLKVPLDRDVIFVAEAGEEGTSSVGIEYLVREHWNALGGDLGGAEFALAEGGGGEARQGKVRYVDISTTEKVPRSTKLIAHGTAGHGSVPRLDNPVVHLADAVAKVGAWQPPMRLNDTTRTYFERLASISSPEDADRYNHVADPKRSAAIQRYFSEHELTHYSCCGPRWCRPSSRPTSSSTRLLCATFS